MKLSINMHTDTNVYIWLFVDCKRVVLLLLLLLLVVVFVLFCGFGAWLFCLFFVSLTSISLGVTCWHMLLAW